MPRPELIIRDATIQDTQLIALAIGESNVNGREFYERYIPEIRRDDSVFSWKCTRVAEFDGVPVGCQIAYSGNQYISWRKRSWMDVWAPPLTEEMIDAAPFEVEEDEYHLDSIAVLPEFRGRGIGRELIMDSVRRGKEFGYNHISFLVECDMPALHDYYSRLGFEDEFVMRIFETAYMKMRYVGDSKGEI